MEEGTENEKMANTGDMSQSSCPLGKAFGGQPFWSLKKKHALWFYLSLLNDLPVQYSVITTNDCHWFQKSKPSIDIIPPSDMIKRATFLSLSVVFKNILLKILHRLQVRSSIARQSDTNISLCKPLFTFSSVSLELLLPSSMIYSCP